MTKIRSSQHLLLAVILNSAWISNAVPKETSDFFCENGKYVHFTSLCDDISDCPDSSDENAVSCENEAVLFYYTYEETLLNCTPLNFTKESLVYCHSEYSGYRNLNITGIYLNHDKELSAMILNETIGPNQVSSRDKMGLMNIFISSNGSQVDVYYTERWKQGKKDKGNAPFVVRSRDSFEYFDPNSGLPSLNFFHNNKYWHQSENIKHTSLMKRDFGTKAADSIVDSRYRYHDTLPKDSRISSLAVDPLTSNVYYILGPRIYVCNENLDFCISLKSKAIQNPKLLTISPNQRKLYWVDQESPTQSYIYEFPLYKTWSTKEREIARILTATWLTVDFAQDRLYWSDLGDNDLLFINSVSITDGFDESQGSEGYTLITISRNAESFAVFNNVLYWSDSEKREILKCPVKNCVYPTVLASIPKQDSFTANNDTIIKKFSIGHLMIDHRTLGFKELITNRPCETASCSHLCLVEPSNTADCFCEISEKPAGYNKVNDYCEGATIIATYKDRIYVIGLPKNLRNDISIIHETDTKIKSIASVTYNSLEGSVILTEMGKQNIYSWIPRTADLQLLVEDGPGTINSIAFDSHSNNLYWIDPVNYTIKVMNLNSRIRANILKGNSTYIPFELTLRQATGNMIVLFQKNNSTTVIEEMSMDGAPTSRKIFYENAKTEGIQDLSVHYIAYLKFLLLLDKQNPEFKTTSSKFQTLIRDEEMQGKIESFLSLGSAVIWSTDDLVIHLGLITSKDKVRLHHVFSIYLGLKKSTNDVLRMTSVVAPASEIQSKCRQKAINKFCSGLCVVSNEAAGFSCLCSKNDTSCQKMSSKNRMSKAILSPDVYSSKELDNQSTESSNENKSRFSASVIFWMILVLNLGLAVGFKVGQRISPDEVNDCFTSVRLCLTSALTQMNPLTTRTNSSLDLVIYPNGEAST